ncbi:MAG: dienelactone hydrolase family protein [Chloroflexota bacterium]|nr:dienelactone hydrolase family protein [Chloroflexota bacterium]MDE3192840.1 dienelactone hydrolase family protein [Chloroflexota bacterium]
MAERSPTPAAAPLPVLSMHAMYVCDGAHVDGYLSRPVDVGPWAAIVVGHSYRGLTPFYREWSRRLAAEGFVVLVPDLYEGHVAADDAEASRLKASLDFDRAARQLAGARGYLRGLPFVRDAFGITGHCLGGGLALMALARSEPGAFACAVIYYHSVYPDDAELRRIHCPVLGHFGTADALTPRAEVEKLEQALHDAGQPFQAEWYEGMGHAFANRADPTPEQRAASEAAWARTIAFFRSHL